MWLNPDLRKNYLEDKNINHVHSCVFLLRITIISYHWWFGGFSNGRLAEIIAVSAAVRVEAKSTMWANSAASSLLFKTTRWDSNCHTIIPPNATLAGYLWNLIKESHSVLRNCKNSKVFHLLSTFSEPKIKSIRD